jgi:hypothetical protein
MGRHDCVEGQRNENFKGYAVNCRHAMILSSSSTHHPRLGLRRAASIFAANCNFEGGAQLAKTWQTDKKLEQSGGETIGAKGSAR